VPDRLTDLIMVLPMRKIMRQF